MRRIASTGIVLLALFGWGCDDSSGTQTADSSSASSKPEASGKAKAKGKKGKGKGSAAPSSKPAAGGMDCSTPKKTIESQVAFIKKGGKVDAFKECFTPRIQEKIDQKRLDKSHDEASFYKLEELYGAEEKSGDDKVKVKMKNGRTLTTLIKEGDKWLADTMWFK